MDYYITYWTIGSSRASCGLEPRNIRFHCKAETEQKALEKLFSKHPQLDSGNIILIQSCNRK